MTRQEARQKILAAANGALSDGQPQLRMRHLNRAVQIVRNRRLLDLSVVQTAGFRRLGPNHRVERAV